MSDHSNPATWPAPMKNATRLAGPIAELGVLTVEDARAFVKAWRDDDQELRIPAGDWGTELAYAIDLLTGEKESSSDAKRLAAHRDRLKKSLAIIEGDTDE